MPRAAHVIALAGAVAVLGTAVTWTAVRPESSKATDGRLACGKDRWAIKTTADADAATIDAKHPKVRTIDWLISQTHAPIHKTTARIEPFETTVFIVRDVTLVEAKGEDDGDVHLVIRDQHGT